MQCQNPFEKESSSSILLTTGADSSFSVQNIYDIAGNVFEWTLEKTSYGRAPCVERGGDCSTDGSSVPAASRSYSTTTYALNRNVGFRLSLW